MTSITLSWLDSCSVLTTNACLCNYCRCRAYVSRHNAIRISERSYSNPRSLIRNDLVALHMWSSVSTSNSEYSISAKLYYEMVRYVVLTDITKVMLPFLGPYSRTLRNDVEFRLRNLTSRKRLPSAVKTSHLYLAVYRRLPDVGQRGIGHHHFFPSHSNAR